MRSVFEDTSRFGLQNSNQVDGVQICTVFTCFGLGKIAIVAFARQFIDTSLSCLISPQISDLLRDAWGQTASKGLQHFVENSTFVGL